MLNWHTYRADLQHARIYDMLTPTHFESAQRTSSRRICTHDVKLEYLFVEKLEACLQFIIRLSMSVCDSDERFGCSNQPTNQPIDQPREHTEVVKTIVGIITNQFDGQ